MRSSTNGIEDGMGVETTHLDTHCVYKVENERTKREEC